MLQGKYSSQPYAAPPAGCGNQDPKSTASELRFGRATKYPFCRASATLLCRTSITYIRYLPHASPGPPRPSENRRADWEVYLWLRSATYLGWKGLSRKSHAMNGTPRLRSGYPTTPQNQQTRNEQHGSATGVASPKVPLPTKATVSQESQGPMIPFNLVDAPSQRLYVAFFYLGLIVWRLCDYYALVSEETDSFQLFMKWVIIDGVVLYGLPGLKIPRLQWSSTTMTMLFALHAIFDYVLMFRVPVSRGASSETLLRSQFAQIPLEAWLIAFTRVFYDRELAVSERRVKPANVLHNASLILGKQIIHILPEG